MSKMIQIRNVPEQIHRRLKANAANEGLSLSEYLLREMRFVAERPTQRELMERFSKPRRGELRPSPAELIREERDRR